MDPSTIPDNSGLVSDPEYFKLPKTCKAGVVVNEGPDFHVEVEDVPVPEPGPNEVLIRLNFTGLCFSDMAFMPAKFGLKMSDFGVRSPGHEGAGGHCQDWSQCYELKRWRSRGYQAHVVNLSEV